MPPQEGPRGDQQTQPPLFGQQPCERGGERVFPEAVAKGHSGVFDEQVAEEAT
ncbi:MAG: hypothetical protein JWN00_299 [Actinomycetia bacterium]|nr:hypothetical protein [Actinomycetes bacterium]